MGKKVLTFEEKCFYDDGTVKRLAVERQNSKTAGGQPPLSEKVVFLCPAGDGVCPGESQRPSCSLPVVRVLNCRTPIFKNKCRQVLQTLTTGVHDMKKAINTNNQTLIQMLYGFHKALKRIQEVPEEIHGDAVSDFWQVEYALENAICALKPLCPEDYKIKAEVAAYMMEINSGMEMDEVEKNVYSVLKELAA